MIVYENPWFRVEQEETFHFVVGNTGGEGAVIVPVIGQDVLLLEMQRVSQQGQTTLEFPRGFGDAGEAALDAARRELREETGYALPASAFRLIGHVRPDTGIMRSRVAVFVADIPDDAEPERPDQEAVARHRLALTDLPAALSGGQIEDGFTLSALALFWAIRR